MSRSHIAALTNLNGRIVDNLAKHPNGRAKSLLDAQRRLLNAMEGITAMRENHNRLETPAAHTLKLTQAAKKLAEQAAKLKAAAYADYQSYSISLSEAILERGNMKENRFASEIRTAFRELPFEKRLDQINHFIERSDGPAFAAIMEAPEVLTGIPLDMNRKLTDSFYQKAAPNLFQEQQDLRDAMDALEASFRVIEAGVNEYSDPVALQKIEEEAQAAQAAANKFNAALQENTLTFNSVTAE